MHARSAPRASRRESRSGDLLSSDGTALPRSPPASAGSGISTGAAASGNMRTVSLRTKVKNALDEARILVLGTQVLLGFQYRAFFEPSFAKLPRCQQSLNLVGLALLLVVIALVMLPAARHRIVERGRDTPELHTFTMNAVSCA